MDEEVLAGCTLDALSSTIEQLAAAQVPLLVGLFDVLREYDRREGWRADGLASMVDWVAARLAVSRATAASWLNVARRLALLPELRAAAAAGGLSWDQLRLLVQLADPRSDAMWAREGPALSPAQLRLMVRRARPIPEEDTAGMHAQRRLRGWWRRDGMYHLSGRLAPDAGAVVQAAIRRLAVAYKDDAGEAEERASLEQRSADALLEMCSCRLGADAHADTAAVVVHADVEVLAGLPGNGELEVGSSVGAETLRRMACDCTMRWVLYERDGAVTVSEAEATIPRWLRRLVRRRDLTCRFPGCERRGWGHIHHVVWRSQKGETRMDNLVFLCWLHHRAVHEGGWGLVGNADGELLFTSPRGQRFTSRPAGLQTHTAQRLFGPSWPPGQPPGGRQPPDPPSRN